MLELISIQLFFSNTVSPLNFQFEGFSVRFSSLLPFWEEYLLLIDELSSFSICTNTLCLLNVLIHFSLFNLLLMFTISGYLLLSTLILLLLLQFSFTVFLLLCSPLIYYNNSFQSCSYLKQVFSVFPKSQHIWVGRVFFSALGCVSLVLLHVFKGPCRCLNTKHSILIVRGRQFLRIYINFMILALAAVFQTWSWAVM